MMATLRRARVMKPMPKGEVEHCTLLRRSAVASHNRGSGKRACNPYRRSASGLRRRGAVRFDQPLERPARAVERTRIAEQPAVVMRGEHDPKQLEGELPGIGLRLELPLVDREADRLGDRAAQLALSGDEQIAHG